PHGRPLARWTVAPRLVAPRTLARRLVAPRTPGAPRTISRCQRRRIDRGKRGVDGAARGPARPAGDSGERAGGGGDERREFRDRRSVGLQRSTWARSLPAPVAGLQPAPRLRPRSPKRRGRKAGDQLLVAPDGARRSDARVRGADSGDAHRLGAPRRGDGSAARADAGVSG